MLVQPQCLVYSELREERTGPRAELGLSLQGGLCVCPGLCGAFGHVALRLQSLCSSCWAPGGQGWAGGHSREWRENWKIGDWGWIVWLPPWEFIYVPPAEGRAELGPARHELSSLCSLGQSHFTFSASVSPSGERG